MTKKKTFKNETALVKAMKKALVKTFGGKWLKIHGGPYQEKGVSDILGCLKGRFIAIEVKQPGREEDLTEYQEKFINEINKNGGIAFMSTDIEQTISRLRGDIDGKK